MISPKLNCVLLIIILFTIVRHHNRRTQHLLSNLQAWLVLNEAEYSAPLLYDYPCYWPKTTQIFAVLQSSQPARRRRQRAKRRLTRCIASRSRLLFPSPVRIAGERRKGTGSGLNLLATGSASSGQNSTERGETPVERTVLQTHRCRAREEDGDGEEGREAAGNKAAEI